MGKLHSLRRAVTRNPEKFVFDNGREKFSIGAVKVMSGWIGVRWKSYRKFVASVLREIGYEVRFW